MKKNALKYLLSLFKRLHLVVNITLATAVLILVILISIKLNRPLSFAENMQALSPRAETMLSKLNGTVKCTVILPTNNIFYNNVRQLLLDMQGAMHNGELELSFIDPHLDVSRAADAIRRYGANEWCLIFEKDDRIEKLLFTDLIETTNKETDAILPGEREIRRFRGEQQCVTAISRLARPVSPVIYSLTGHGEREFNDYDGSAGYSDLGREIRREGYILNELQLAEHSIIPADCNLLIIAGPQKSPSQSEVNAITEYLSHGGRLLFLLDRQSHTPNGWEPILTHLGLKLPNLTAISETTHGGFQITIDKFSDHVISKELNKMTVIFSSPQVLDIDPEAVSRHRLETEIIANTNDRVWGESEPEKLPRRYDPGIDRHGNLPIVIASEVAGSTDLGIDLMRAVTFGDSNIGANAFLGGGNTANRDIILNTIGWLTDSGMPSAPSLTAQGNALQLNFSTKRQLRFWRNSVFIWPISVSILGLIAAYLKKIFS